MISLIAAAGLGLMGPVQAAQSQAAAAQTYDLRMRLTPGLSVAMDETGKSEQTIELPSGVAPQKMTSDVKGHFTLNVDKLSADGASGEGNVLISTDSATFVTSFMALGGKQTPPQNYTAKFHPTWLIEKVGPDDQLGVNPSRIMAPLTVVPIFAPVPQRPVKLGETWQASLSMFKGIGLTAKGMTAVFTLDAVTADAKGPIASISGRGTVPFVLTADQIQQQVQSAHMMVPALNMSATGNVQWVLKEKLDLATGTVVSVELFTSTSATLHLTTLEADAHLTGSASILETMPEGSKPAGSGSKG